MLIHTLRTYFRRFWREITGFWLLSGVASWMTWRDSGAQALAGMAVLESLALLVAVIRLMQAENVFSTLGGWRVRPLSRLTLRHARWGLFALLLLPAVLGRVSVCAALFSPGAAEWRVLAVQVWLPLLTGCVLGAAAAGWIGRDASHGNAYKTPALIWGVILISAGCWAGYAVSRRSFAYSHGSTTGSPAPFVRAKSPLLEKGVPREAATMVPLVRLPLRAGEGQSDGGCRITLTECAQSGGRARVAVTITVPAGGLRPWSLIHGPNGDMGPRLYIRYGDGSWAPQADRFHFSRVSPLSGLGIEQFILGGSFATPLGFPENDKTWDQLAADAECVVFVPQITGTAHAASSQWEPPPDALRTWDPQAPALEFSPAAIAVKAAVEAVTQRRSEGWNDAKRLLESAGPDGVTEALRFSWPAHDWEAVVLPFLKQHSAGGHLPILLKELETEPRLCAVFIAKGWQTHALPILRRQLQDGLPLPSECLELLAGAGDAALAPALHAATVRCLRPGPGLKDRLKSHPGIDWPRLVREAWRFHCFAKYPHDQDFFNPWLESAAGAGEKDALRDLAARWLLRFPPMDAVTRLIGFAGQSGDFPAWLRANFERLQWDAGTSRWMLP